MRRLLLVPYTVYAIERNVVQHLVMPVVGCTPERRKESEEEEEKDEKEERVEFWSTGRRMTR